jgi:hypothetical protein
MHVLDDSDERAVAVPTDETLPCVFEVSRYILVSHFGHDSYLRFFYRKLRRKQQPDIKR